MELRHLRYLCAVVDWHGFNRAARALHISQSAISEQILDLEEEIGVPLLNRSQHRASLTPAGEIFIEEARKVLAAADRAVDLAQRSMRGEIGSLSIGFLVWGTGAFFPGIIRDFRHLYPDVRVSLMEMVPGEQARALIKGTLDIAFTRPLEPPYDRQLRWETLYMDPLIAVLPYDHPLASFPLKLETLANEAFILCDRSISPTLFDTAMALCAQAGFSPKITQTSNVLSSALTLVQAGEGVTLIPSSFQYFRSSDLSFCPLADPSGSVELIMAWSPEREGALQKAFLDFIRAKKQLIRASMGVDIPQQEKVHQGKGAIPVKRRQPQKT
jgi:DNA-binding transcriptional LysR family regulator